MPYEYRTKRKIEFADTDLAGICHFARFFVFMETAEHEFLNSLGTSVSTELNGNQIGWPRLAASCEYLTPVRFEEVVDIHLTVFRKGTKSMTYKFVFTKDDAVVVRGHMTSACCVCNPGEPVRAIAIPDFIAEKLEEAPKS
ncbi:acyl-CoA thioesterase [candidate division KSB1 bacterium]|nr:acyl-CoA thioesterase [candidate division KSB1 bacterium]NIR69140.1 acyl-CoA thioesterase [candidate division KSB1 bacterium]NIS25651.1 acyl-CoA thioesterase [candidate division KSB1 bacterium]NIT72519.1 acyl-CoA thioesterase [candidate division KSB1 bacterium]NIU26328.1 acyl-CoA thioesterase [candidate division KSB1 bacterium]